MFRKITGACCKNRIKVHKTVGKIPKFCVLKQAVYITAAALKEGNTRFNPQLREVNISKD